MIHLIAKKHRRNFICMNHHSRTILFYELNQISQKIIKIRKTEFEHHIDHTIRLKDTTSCMAVDATNTNTFLPPNAIAFTPCFEDIERWIYNEGTNQIISEKYMQCLTAKHVPVTSSFYLGLQQCGDNNKLQKWIFQTDNKNPEIIENNPEISINDMEEWRLEESNALTTTINSPIFC